MVSSRVRLHFVVVLVLAAQTTTTSAETRRPFPSPIANPFETRNGFIWQATDERLRLDIGANVDLWREKCPDSVTAWTIGADVQTWTRLRSESNFKFPVETVDYWFGVHGTYGSESSVHARLRLAHISSHLVDGMADSAGLLTPPPFVYSREFADVFVGYTAGFFRPYMGLTIVWSTQPRDANRIIPQTGCDIRIPIAMNNTVALHAGYHLSLIGINGVYAASHAFQAGIVANTANGVGVMVGMYGFNGRSMHGMYFREKDDYVGLGLQLLF